MSKCGFSSLNLFWALTWSARSHPKRTTIATPALNPLLEPRPEIRLRRCHSISSERLNLLPGLRMAVVSHRIWIGLHPSTTCVICFMTSILCTTFSRRISGIHRLVLNLIGSGWHWDRCSRLCACTGSSSLVTCKTPQVRCCQAYSSFFRLGDLSFESCTASFRVSLSSLPLREASAPEASFSQLTSALLMYRRRAFPIASASAIAGELTSRNTTRTSLRNVRSTRSVASRRLTVRTLCMPLSVPT